MAGPRWLQGDPAALSVFTCAECDKKECRCGEEDPDRMYNEMMEG